MKSEILSQDKLSWLAFLSIVLAYGFIYAPYGLENNDGGFILGLSHQVFLGGKLYDDVIYVRPPVSPILHSFVFYYPFSLAPILFDRLFFYIQVSIYSALSAILAKKFFDWGSAFSGVVASIIFVFSSHTFPPMGWHTVDGVFFSVVALYFLILGLKENHGFLFLAACFSILAAGSKQPYYLMPIMLWALSFVIGYKRRAFYVMTASLFFAGALFLIVFKYFGSVELMPEAISSQAHLRDLYAAGVKSYAADILRINSIVAVLPLFAAFAFSFFSKKEMKKWEAIQFFVAIFIFLMVILNFYVSLKKKSSPFSVFDSVFMVTFLYSIIMMLKERKDGWIVIVAMHIIGWASSISWIYQTTILYAAPSVISLAFNLRLACKRSLFYRAASIAILPVSVLIFYIGNKFIYSLEEVVPRSSATVDMSEISSSFKFIKTDQGEFQVYRELNQLVSRLGDYSYVVLPNMPLAHVLTNTANPIGIDWLLNAEVGSNEKIIKDRLASSVDYALIYKKARPKPEQMNKFGSSITLYVMQNWKVVDSIENFNIYENPLNH
nr:hypothetical protein [uncultured Rhodoferax sp.]